MITNVGNDLEQLGLYPLLMELKFVQQVRKLLALSAKDEHSPTPQASNSTLVYNAAPTHAHVYTVNDTNRSVNSVLFLIDKTRDSPHSLI